MKVNVACSAEGCSFNQAGTIHDNMLDWALDGKQLPVGRTQVSALGLAEHQKQTGHTGYFAMIDRPNPSLKFPISVDSNGDFILNPPIDS